MNNYQKGFNYDMQIVDLLSNHSYLTSKHVADMVYGKKSQSLRLSRRKLQSLYERKYINRYYLAKELGYVYYVHEGKPSFKVHHWLSINEVYVATENHKNSWQSIETFELEPCLKWNSGQIQPDAFVVLKVTLDKRRTLFLETDLGTVALSKFDKIQKYTELYRTDVWLDTKYAVQGELFPIIYIVTTTDKRAKAISNKIESENVEGLTFVVKTIANIKEKGLW